MGHYIKSGWGRFIAGVTAMLMLAWMSGAEFTGVIDWEPTAMFVLAALAWLYSCFPDDASRPAASPSPEKVAVPSATNAKAIAKPATPLIADAPVAAVARYLREEANFKGMSDDQISRTLVDNLANPGVRLHGWVRDDEHSALVRKSVDYWSEVRLDVRQSLVFEPMLVGDPLVSFDPQLNWDEVRALWPAQKVIRT